MPASGPIRARLVFLLFSLVSLLPAQPITTIAGNIFAGEGRRAREAAVVSCRAVTAAPDGTIYFSDEGSRTVLRIDPATNMVSVLAGGGTVVDDLLPVPARSAYLNLPVSLAVGPDRSVYIAEDSNHRIRRVDVNGKISTVAGDGIFGSEGDGGPAIWAHLGAPHGVAVDGSGNIYIAEFATSAIRKVEAATGIIRTLAGGPTATATGEGIAAKTARVQLPSAIAVDAAGNVFFSEQQRHVVRKIESATGLIRTVAGNGSDGFAGDGGLATAAQVGSPNGLAVGANGDLYIVHPARLRKVTAATGVISTVVGGGTAGLVDGMRGTDMLLNSPGAQLFVTAANILLIALPEYNVVAQLNLNTGIVNLVAGDPIVVGDFGPAERAVLASPFRVALDPGGNLYISDTNHHRVRRIAPGPTGVGTGTTTTVAGMGISDTGREGTPATETPINHPQGLLVDSGNVYFTDGGILVRRVGSDGLLRTVAGRIPGGYSGDGGPAISAQLAAPSSLARDGAGNLYIADAGNHRIRVVDPSGVIRTIAGTGAPGFSGDGGPAASAQLQFPSDVLLDGRGGLLIADTENARIRRMDLASGRISTIAGNGTRFFTGDGGPALGAGIPGVMGLALDTKGNLYVTSGNAVRRIDAATQMITTVAGSMEAGLSGDDGPAVLARMRGPTGLVMDSAGNLIIADSFNHRVRKVSGTLVPPELVVGPATLNFNAVQGVDPPFGQPVQVTTRNLANVPFTVTVRYDSGSDWLAFGGPGGMTPGLLMVGIKAVPEPGAYSATLSITSPGAGNSPQTVRVTLNVAAGTGSKLVVDRDHLEFHAVVGGASPPAQTIRVSNAGSGQISWFTGVLFAAGSNWLTISPTSGEGPATLTISVSTSGLTGGLYEAFIGLNNRGAPGPVVVSVAFFVHRPLPSLLLSHLGTLFIANEGSSSVAPDTLQIVNVGQGDLEWTSEVRPLTGGEWFSVSPASGTVKAGASGTATLTARPAGMAAGVYSALVTIFAPGALNTPQMLLAQLIVQAAGTPPTGVVRPGGIAFVGAAGSAAQQSSISITTSGGAALSYSAAASTSDGATWLSVSPPGGSLQGSADRGSLSVQANPANLAAGVYRGKVALSFSNSGIQEVSVLLVVTSAPIADAHRAGPGAGAACTPTKQNPVVTSMLGNFNMPLAWPATLLVKVLDDCGNGVDNSTVIATFSNGDAALTLRFIGNGTYSGTWSPTRPGATLITVRATGASLQTGSTDPISGTVATSGAGGSRSPLVYRNGVLSGASYTKYAPVAPGQIVALFGSNLASEKAQASRIPLPTSLGGVTAKLATSDVPLYYADSGQVNAQVPFDLSAGETFPLLVQVGGVPSPPEPVTVTSVQPGIFTVNSSGSGAGVVVSADGKLIDSSNPAKAGQVVVVYATGLGATSPAVKAGEASPSGTPAVVSQTVSAFVAGAAGKVEFAGLTPGLVGLYQINLRIPENTAAGAAVELYLTQGTVASNKVTLVVQ